MRFINDEDSFWKCSPAAPRIMAYRRENPEVAKVPWAFEKAYVSDDGRSISASFWFGALSGWGKDELTINASRKEDGSWDIKHAIKRAP